jgi:GT2 family glycosyltransferase
MSGSHLQESMPSAIPSAGPVVPRVGVVVIGRNEGERLKRCLGSLVGRAERIVYVDSGSSDGSQAWARSQGVVVLELDMSVPFTMARGRNAGWRWFAEQADPVDFIQFVDGDCEVVPGWIETAMRQLHARPDLAAVGGLRRERAPDETFYNRLVDLEWIRLPGEGVHFLGDVMVRLDALGASGGFHEGMIAGEEGELCVRLEQRGYRLLQLDAPMSLHDMGMRRFQQWWRRAVRGGHAYAEAAWLHGRSPRRYQVSNCIRALAWGALWPLLLVASVVLGAVVAPGFWLATATLAGLLLLHLVRAAVRRRREFGTDWRWSLIYAWFCFLAKPAQVVGILSFAGSLLRGRAPTLIEYRDPS